MEKMKLLPYEVKSVDTTTMTLPYGVKQIKAPEVWERAEKGRGVVVAILDTGIDITHPDLAESIIGGCNFTDEGSKHDITDRNGHGTHVAGIIAARENDSGVVGVSPECKLLICKVLNSEGEGDYRGITAAIKWATKWRGPNGEKVRVINMSLGGSNHDNSQYKAILEACSKGILVVVASGNEGDSDETTYEFGYPALYNECVTVAACNEKKELAYFSNNSKQIDVIAAGVDVVSTYPKSKYAVLSGTSMATPHVSGALALIINIGEKHFGRILSESEIFSLLVQCCCSLDYKPSSEGHGLLDLTKLNNTCTK